jgi:DNA-binding transcriptional LysR family regulator
LVEAGLGIALLSQSNAAEELKSSALSSIAVGDLTASQDVVAVTRRGGFLSAASHRLLDIFRSRFRGTKS